ncbi:MAG: HAD family hydrolase [Oscillospiraceae bacterium]|nr:HAD family hydrolase [Oscillospiraceae bacterium]
MSRITHIFFDIGSTLVDETECYNHRIRDMIAGTDITFEQFCEKAKLLGFGEAIKFFGLTKTPWHSEDERLYPDTAEILQYLCDRGYTLGIIANQAAGTEQRLDKWGIRQYFSSVTASSEEGVAKPDFEIFRRALEKAGCSADCSVMVGDRLDNDIAPAKALGMKTVWIKQGMSVYSSPQGDFEQPVYTIANLTELKRIF